MFKSPMKKQRDLQQGGQTKISVVVTAFNHEKYISQCLDSILMQKGTFDLEIILGDDYSQDKTREIMESYARKNPGKFVLLPVTKNLGISKNIKRCIDACSGRYIAFCEGDDYWIDNGKLQKQMTFLDQHPDYSLCFNRVLLKYEEKNKFTPHKDQLLLRLLRKKTLTIEDLLKTNYICGLSSCMYRASVIKNLPEHLFDMYVADWMINMVCCEYGKIGYIPTQMSVYRIHRGGAWSGKPRQQQLSELYQVLISYNKFFDYRYDKQFSRLKDKIILEYKRLGARVDNPYNQKPNELPGQPKLSMKEYGSLLIRTVKHPKQAYFRLRTSFSIAFRELTSAALSTREAQAAQLAVAVQSKDSQTSELSSLIPANITGVPQPCKKLNIGCGKVKLPGWVNIDIEPGADLVIDVRGGLPFDSESVDFIYNEHFIEHLTYEEGENFLRECWRCLKQGGVLRIATVDLDFLVAKYSEDFKNRDWFPPGFEFVKTKGMAMNMCFTWWGHRYIYNEEDLRSQLIKAGFHKVKRCKLNESDYLELTNLETRKESRLIVEATK